MTRAPDAEGGAVAAAVGVDLGGSFIKAGLVDRSLNVVERAEAATEADGGPEHVIGRIVGVVERLAGAGGPISGVGVGSPGPLSASRGVVLRSVNLPGWRDVPLRKLLEDRLGVPVVMDNDANAAAFGEYCVQGDRGDLVLMTLGTGVGGGAVVGGQVLRGWFENASEIGHLIVEPEGRACPCGQRGCLERYASATALVDLAREAMTGGASSCLAGRARADEGLTGRDVAEAAMAGDAVAERIWDRACRALAIACVQVHHMVNPARIVFGGGLAGAGEGLMGPLRTHFEALRWRLADDVPELRLARLGNDSGVVGAAALLFSAVGLSAGADDGAGGQEPV